MKSIIPLLLLCLLATRLQAVETLPIERAREAAKLISESPGAISSTPFKIENDLEKPQVLKAEGIGFLVLPAKELTEDMIAKAGKDVVPLGSLWMLKVVPMVEGKAVASDKLRHTSVQTKDSTLSLACYQFGVQKNDKDGLDLVLFSKDKTPILKTALEKKSATQEYPIELDGRKEGDASGVLTINVLGKYKAEITVAPEE